MKKNIKRDIFQYIIIFIIVLLIRSFIFTPIRVRQNSMYPTLKPNDIMILNKVGLHFKKLSRFDIVVIKLNNEYIIKRIIGLPFESVIYKDSKLYINNKEIKEEFKEYETEDFSLEDIGYENIPNNKYFVLGDNRVNSTDSRVIGLIDKKDIIGKTNFIIFPFNDFGTTK